MNIKNSEFESYPEIQNNLIPDFVQIAQQKVQSLKTDGVKKAFDPYQMMLDRNRLNSGEIVNTVIENQWPEKDIKVLEDFCKKYGIVGYNCGRMHPIAALAMLKNNLGVGDSLDENIPIGYEKISKQNYPYSNTVK